ncbi:MAG: hypothetical protein K0U98_10405 [Deltaproteobacteria bacterium]|nr:hypothetical protein [Deltaproteobacteria bacterium]
MKKILFTTVLLALAGSATPRPLPTEVGIWVNPSFERICGPTRVCAEFMSNGEHNGQFCCIDERDLNSTSFEACKIRVLNPPREDDDG